MISPPPSVAEPWAPRYRPTVVKHVLALLIGIVALAGCGDDSDGGATTETSPESSSALETELAVVLDEGEGAPPEEWTLTCDPAGGTHPDPGTACDALADLDPEIFEPVPPDAMCTMIYGGPQTAMVTGQWHGAPIDAEFSRENGCEIARWDAAVAVLGHEGGVQSTSS